MNISYLRYQSAPAYLPAYVPSGRTVGRRIGRRSGESIFGGREREGGSNIVIEPPPPPLTRYLPPPAAADTIAPAQAFSCSGQGGAAARGRAGNSLAGGRGFGRFSSWQKVKKSRDEPLIDVFSAISNQQSAISESESESESDVSR